jgi:hypothetical protein
MRIRTIKPEFWSHPVMAAEADEVRLAAIGLLNYADDEGYFLASPAAIRAAIWAFDEDSTRARRVLDRLISVGWIVVAKHPTHGPVGFVVNFTKHQRVDRPSPSKLKCYFLDESSTNPRRALDEHSSLDQGSGNRDQGTGYNPPMGSPAPASTPQLIAMPNAADAQGVFFSLKKIFEKGTGGGPWHMGKLKVQFELVTSWAKSVGVSMHDLDQRLAWVCENWRTRISDANGLKFAWPKILTAMDGQGSTAKEKEILGILERANANSKAKKQATA